MNNFLKFLTTTTHEGYTVNDPVYTAGLTPGTITTWSQTLSKYHSRSACMVMEGASTIGF